MSIKQQIYILLKAIDSEAGVDENLKKRKKALIQNLVESAIRYIDIVTKQGIAIQIHEGVGDRENLEELANMDQKRSKIHDSLISQIAIVNRMCQQFGLDPIYKGESNRRDKGNFAWELVTAYFQDRI